MLTALLIALSLTAAPKSPPAPAPAETAEVKQARELFQAGQKLYKEKKYAEAIAKFEQANTVRPHPVIAYNIGRCYEQMGDIPRAMRAYRDYLRLAPEAKDRQQVSDSVAALEKRLRDRGQQQLMVFADPPNARISVDGKDFGTSPASMELVAGNHMLTIVADGYETYERSFVMQTARAADMTIALRQAAPTPVNDVPRADQKNDLSLNTPPTPPPVTMVEKKPRVATWVVGGIAVVGAGVGVGLGLSAQGKVTEMRSGEHDQQTVQQLHDDAQAQAMGANIAYGVAGAALVTAVVLFILEK